MTASPVKFRAASGGSSPSPLAPPPSTTPATLETTLAPVCEALGGRMVPFAGYRLPLQFADGIVKEHLATREGCGLFEVSHLRQAVLSGPGAAAAIETQVPADIGGLPQRRQVYTQMLLPTGGIVDDLLVTRLTDGGGHGRFLLVNNASRREAAWSIWRQAASAAGADFAPCPDHSIVAVQGPGAQTALIQAFDDALPGLADAVANLWFLDLYEGQWGDEAFFLTRSGYTGEDGFELYLPPSLAERAFRALADLPGVTLAGLGARDTLRLEAGLPLYGQDLNETTSPVETGLTWSIPRARRERADFPGADVILAQIKDGAPRRRLAIALTDRGVPRAGWRVEDQAGTDVGEVTSGGFGPSADCGIALCLVRKTDPGTKTGGLRIGEAAFLVSGKRRLEGKAVKPPFVPHRYRLPPRPA